MYNGVSFDSVSDVIVCQKSSKGNWKLQFLWWDYNFTQTLCAKYKTYCSTLKVCWKWVCALILIEHGIKFELKEIYSTVPNGYQRKPKQPNGDYLIAYHHIFDKRDRILLQFLVSYIWIHWGCKYWSSLVFIWLIPLKLANSSI